MGMDGILMKVVVVAIGTGFGLWVVDNRLCAPLRVAREAIGLPWAWVLELHGW